MNYIDINQPITYAYASLRFFKPRECHVSRICPENVLLLVYDGILRFIEDGKVYEIYPGQYHIQRQGSVQVGKYASDVPQYLYVHFWGSWTDDKSGLPRSGVFDYKKFKPIMEELHTLNSTKTPHYIQAAKFYKLLSLLQPTKTVITLADKIAAYLTNATTENISIERLCEEFHFSKNHIINVFKQEYGVTPIIYLNELRLNYAESLMKATSNSLEQISLESGFQTYSHFYKMFLRRHGYSPEQWRKNIRAGLHPHTL